jgi:flagellar basal body P-ring formation protein FlgA
MFVNRLTLVAVGLLLLASAASFAQSPTHSQPPGVQSIASIRSFAEKALRAAIGEALPGVELSAAPLDARLRLAACPMKLDSFIAPLRFNQSRTPVRVSCAAPAWTVHVPVEIRRAHSVLVLRRAVGRGERLVAADVTSQTRVLPGLASPFLSSPDQLESRLTRRPLPEGTPLPAEALSAALLIHRGQNVTLVANSAGFEVRAPGRAMADAAAHQRVRVQNLNSLKIIEGVADTDGVVRVTP